MSKNQTISIKDVSPTANKQRPRKEQRDAAQSFISTIQGINFPNSKRIYITGTRSDIQVPMREIQLDKTLIGGSKEDPIFEENEPIPVYDTSGPYGDPTSQLDVNLGLKKFANHGLMRVMIPNLFHT